MTGKRKDLNMIGKKEEKENKAHSANTQKKREKI